MDLPGLAAFSGKRKYDLSWAQDSCSFEVRIPFLEASAEEKCVQRKKMRLGGGASSSMTMLSSSTEEAIVPNESHLQQKKAKAWTMDEDSKLIRYVNECCGARPRWTQIAERIGNKRTGKQVRERWLNKLDPSINKRPWSMRDDHAIALGVAKVGYRWVEISKILAGRSDNAIKNRWHSIKRKLVKFSKRHESISKTRSLSSLQALRALPRSVFVQSIAVLHACAPTIDTFVQDDAENTTAKHNLIKLSGQAAFEAAEAVSTLGSTVDSFNIPAGGDPSTASTSVPSQTAPSPAPASTPEPTYRTAQAPSFVIQNAPPPTILSSPADDDRDDLICTV